jgi:tRNA1Val (adenine37-N6)-methyltransferase
VSSILNSDYCIPDYFLMADIVAGPIFMTAKIPDGIQIDRLCGDYIIYQPQVGQRYTTDDMLVAWMAVRKVKESEVVPASFLDLGSGLCSVPMIVLWSFPAISGVGVEISPGRSRLGALSLAKNGLTERFKLMGGDLRGLGLHKRFSLVTSSPPYYQESEGPVSPDADKAGVRFELHGNIEDYCRTAAEHLEQGGMFATVYPFQYRLRALHAARRCGLSLEREVRVIPREGKPPLLSLFILGLHGSGADAQEELVIRGEDYLFTEAFRRVRREVGFPDKLK